jgi:hypothetical protein
VAFLDDGNKPVALPPRATKGYDRFDPADDRTVRVDREMAGKLSGIAYVFYRPFPHQRLTPLALVTPFATGIVFPAPNAGSFCRPWL